MLPRETVGQAIVFAHEKRMNRGQFNVLIGPRVARQVELIGR